MFVEPGGKLKSFPNVYKVGDLGNPYRYTFDGWYKDNQKFNIGTAINENLTLKAEWYCPGNRGGSHRWREVDSKGFACGNKLIIKKCGVCSKERENWIGSNKNHKWVYCDEKHEFNPNIEWKMCTSKNSGHKFNYYRHKICLYCGMETTKAKDVIKTSFNYNGKDYDITRKIVFCGVHDPYGLDTHWGKKPGKCNSKNVIDHNAEVVNIINKSKKK